MLYSDNGTNFVSAAELLRKDSLEFMKSLQPSVLQTQHYQDMEWKFIPPGAPHMGGIWEAGVKSFKIHLRKSVPKMTFTFEDLSTILTKIEGCLNSRPLTPDSDDPNDICPLTPRHFLIVTPLLAPPELDISHEDLNTRNRWKRLRIITQRFCERWKSEYLTQLHRRYKWQRQTKNIEINTLVILKDNNLLTYEWKMGRVVQIYPGSDGNTRVVI